MPERSPHRIEILAFAQANLLDISGPAQVFATANDLCQAAGRRHPAYDTTLVAPGAAVVTSAGLTLQAAPLPKPDRPLGTLVVAGGAGVGRCLQDASLLGWLRARAACAERLASVCSGAFLLAEAGLLDGRRAVTHWQRGAEFARRYPAVRLEQDAIYVQDGHIWTSAGITAGIDLALALVEADLGHPLALAVARHLVVFLKRPGGQSQFSATLALQSADAAFAPLHAWMSAHLRERLPLERLAAQAGMSLRSFCRHYKASTGQSPAEAVELMRVERGRHLLEAGQSVARAASACGFGTSETMRRAFLRHIGVGPSDYRERFREHAEALAHTPALAARA
ncbi:GlxA family transcriptional regulator [Acidisoma sp. C75]